MPQYSFYSLGDTPHRKKCEYASSFSMIWRLLSFDHYNYNWAGVCLTSTLEISSPPCSRNNQKNIFQKGWVQTFFFLLFGLGWVGGVLLSPQFHWNLIHGLPNLQAIYKTFHSLDFILFFFPFFQWSFVLSLIAHSNGPPIPIQIKPTRVMSWNQERLFTYPTYPFVYIKLQVFFFQI